MKKQINRWLALALVVVGFAACHPARQAASTSNPQQHQANEVEVNEPAVDLAGYLRRVPGVRVVGSGSNVRVYVRNPDSITQGNEPLFVIDGRPVGTGYEHVASLIEVNDIASVRVLKDASETAVYGIQGANGVIEIWTKRNDEQ